MICPKCGYVMDSFEKECPRCHGEDATKDVAQAAPQTPAPVPSQRRGALSLPQPPLQKLDRLTNYQKWPLGAQVGAISWIFFSIFMMEFYGIGIVLLVLPLIGIYFADQAHVRTQVETIFANFEGFHVTRRHLSRSRETGIAFDQETKQLCLLRMRGNYVQQVVVCAKDIVICEIVEQANWSEASGTDDGLVWWLFLGWGGLLINWLTSLNQRGGTARSIDLKLAINDVSNPYYMINFLDRDASYRSSLYTSARERANYWLTLIKVLKNQR